MTASDDALLTEARDNADYAAGRALFEEYAAQLGVDLCFQNFSHELAHLAEIYGGEAGCLLLARLGDEPDDLPVGCVGVRAVAAVPGTCEMKRLYVQPQARGTGLGRRLAIASLVVARARGYQRMVLDTLPTLTAALQLYADLGFREIAPYYPNPLPGVVYLGLDLDAQPAGE